MSQPASGLTPFIGREDEVRLLLNRWSQVGKGQGQVIAVMSEAGIGESRPVQRFREQIAGTPRSWSTAQPRRSIAKMSS
jgi:predicted ATPase